MGKVKTMANEATTNTVKKTYKFYNDQLELVSKEVEVSITPAVSTPEAMQRLGNNDALVLKALNAMIQRMAISEARRTAVTDGINKKVVLNVIKPFRLLPPWSTMVDDSLTGAAKSEAKRKQTAALLELVRSNPTILAAVKAASSTESDDDDDAEDGDDGDE